eukprot:2114471-Rhodomonas_salina.2
MRCRQTCLRCSCASAVAISGVDQVDAVIRRRLSTLSRSAYFKPDLSIREGDFIRCQSGAPCALLGMLPSSGCYLYSCTFFLHGVLFVATRAQLSLAITNVAFHAPQRILLQLPLDCVGSAHHAQSDAR